MERSKIQLSIVIFEQNISNITKPIKGKFCMKKPKSPCIDICNFSGPNGSCLGCGRTRQECNAWKKLKPYNIKILSRQLTIRMSEIALSKMRKKAIDS